MHAFGVLAGLTIVVVTLTGAGSLVSILKLKAHCLLGIVTHSPGHWKALVHCKALFTSTVRGYKYINNQRVDVVRASFCMHAARVLVCC